MMFSQRFSILAAAVMAAIANCVLAEMQSSQYSWLARTTTRVQVLSADDLKVEPNNINEYVSPEVGLKAVVRPASNDSLVVSDDQNKDQVNTTKETSSKTTLGEKASGKVIAIGKNVFPKKQVTKIGDVDGNGFDDYIVAQPTAKKNAGSVRLYLMKENNQFAFSRELVPGKWGFNGAELQSGDMFGSAVFRLPPTTTGSSCIVAVGAPGDNAKGLKKGAIYILNIAQNGSVTKARKISADSDSSLDRQHYENEGFGTDIKAIGDLNGDGDFELAVKSLLGSTTMLFLNGTHEVKTSLKVHNEGSSELMSITEKYRPSRSDKLDSTQLSSISVRASAPGQCFFNETSCACGLKSPEKGSNSCLDVVGTDPGTGRTLCIARDCEASYACSCDGSELCNRIETTTEVYTPQESAGSGKVFCSKTPVTRSTNIVQVGVPIPTTAPTEVLSTFNATHCSCSPKKSLVAPYECLDLIRTLQNQAVICQSRECAIGEGEYACDGLGSSYCTRNFAQRTYFVNDGAVSGELGNVYCHQVSREVETVTLVA